MPFLSEELRRHFLVRRLKGGDPQICKKGPQGTRCNSGSWLFRSWATPSGFFDKDLDEVMMMVLGAPKDECRKGNKVQFGKGRRMELPIRNCASRIPCCL